MEIEIDILEEEVESKKIDVYGNISDELFGNKEIFTYLCSKHEP